MRAVSELEVRPGMNRRERASSTHAALVDNKIEWNFGMQWVVTKLAFVVASSEFE